MSKTPSPDVAVESAGDNDEDAGNLIGSPFRVAFRNFVATLHELAARTDLSDRQNFHHAMSLIFSNGVNQSVFAEWRGFRATTVSRWVNGSKAPPTIRRAAIVKDALAMLDREIANKTPVVTRSFAEADDGSGPVRAVGRPKRVQR